jgi:hypothetical protein
MRVDSQKRILKLLSRSICFRVEYRGGRDAETPDTGWKIS